MVNYTPHLVREETNQFEEPIATIMDRSYLWFEAASSIETAIDKIVAANITGAPVLNKEKRLVGFLSQKDCLKLATQLRYLNEQPRFVEDYMSHDIYSMNQKTTIFHAIQSFIDRWFHAYPVTDDDGHVVGVLSRNKVLEFVNQQSQTAWKGKKAS
ncbi:CBS domain-containing protein [Pseudobacteriovorax antillogorgiicola]|uniref:CBS domain-containing protein n=2 Tax=Pseudobacteriovorax antillogorgiicola TaxID=1513793 RepID=A0A1Y6C445_9BACT|nr:CBS domain protein [Pseudobacteriovorax antillogorgiicola]SMF36098.1 CBS domain-containing protein [Pseudobacteriovorax antillogorgiicola]